MYKFVEVPANLTAEEMVEEINKSPEIINLRATGHRAVGLIGMSHDTTKAIMAYEAPCRGDFLHLILEVPLLIAGVFIVLIASGIVQ